ncbi:AAA family ATPase [Herbaspirillum sp. DW155]|uniref:ATP-dependent nuclease n=1 Tax=Herbaspirillum TaxID=963 RepID=UPI001C65E514|nr:AAA family ATPase [Herbaspirillum rubrisubalbicans]BEV16831.1 AAA family ATPase [Herbaspirillum sp. DW155]
MNNRSKLVRISVRNIGCVGPEGVEVALDDVVCLVGRNNAGKSTILRSYELAKGTLPFTVARDRYQHAPDDEPSEIFLDVHIPDGIGNVDPKWKEDVDGLRIVRSRWQWFAPSFSQIRSTWDPSANGGSGGWAEDAKAGGADPVFLSRLPRPIRIGSLDDTAKMEETLLQLVLAPLIRRVEEERLNKESRLAHAISDIASQIATLSAEHTEHFQKVSDRVTNGFQSIFPSLHVQLNVSTLPLSPKLGDLLKNGSTLDVSDDRTKTSLHHQGTGARRALFWAMVQVHNELSRDGELRAEYRDSLLKGIKDCEAKKKKKGEDVAAQDSKIEELQAKLRAHDAGGAIPVSDDDPAFPGYLLLIDEPENALHPIAARAAQRHLYQLASNPDWQVMLTTHSPYFINPFEDHTTIVRLERSGGSDGGVTHRTYRSDLIGFNTEDKRRLAALQHIDPSFSEVFFGSYPILVEGDTEHAAFISSIVETDHALLNQITIVRARGKAILAPLISVLTHFKINFGLLHDVDPPYKKDGSANGMWTENIKILQAVQLARESGVEVRHRVSVPDFERFLGGEEENKDKPLSAYLAIAGSKELQAKVQHLLTELMSSSDLEPFSSEDPQCVDYDGWLRTKIAAWAKGHGLGEEIRFAGKGDA